MSRCARAFQPAPGEARNAVLCRARSARSAEEADVVARLGGTMKRAVLFDWRRTLVVPPEFEDWVRDGLGRCDREADAALVDELVIRIAESNGPGDRLDTPGMDADRTFHRKISLGVLADAGIDDELAEAIYESESDWRQNPFPVDAAPRSAPCRMWGYSWESSATSTSTSDPRSRLSESRTPLLPTRCHSRSARRSRAPRCSGMPSIPSA